MFCFLNKQTNIPEIFGSVSAICAKTELKEVSNWQMYAGLACIMIGIVGIAIAFIFACC